MSAEAFDLSLPATSANLGPAFDAAGLAFNLALRVRADVASGGADTVEATGRDAAICGDARDHLILNVYRKLLEREGRRAPALALRLDNAIPIGKGCGSSAAARLAGVALAAHFGALDWDAQQVFEEAVALEGHPDNVAACWWGGLVVSRQSKDAIDWLRVPAGASWPLLLAVPAAALATEEARSVMPAEFSRADAVANLQNALLLLQAWQQGRGDLLAGALEDRWHQPYRARLCPLLPALRPLVGREGILGVALSGAGPSVLMILKSRSVAAAAEQAAGRAIAAAGLEAELLPAELEPSGPGTAWNTPRGKPWGTPARRKE